MPKQEPSINSQSKEKTTQAKPASSTGSRTAASGTAKAKPAAPTAKAASTRGIRRTSNGDVAERVRQRAYEIWEREGRPEGREQAHWEQAEREIAKARGARRQAIAR